MITRFLIGFGLGALIAFNCSCMGEAAPLELTGLPADPTQFQQTYDYINAHGAQALDKPPSDYLHVVTRVDFVPGIILCDERSLGTEECYGVTAAERGSTWSTVVMVLPEFGQPETTDVRCTALAHELAHSLIYSATGDPDVHHTNDAIWGDTGVVVSFLETYCPAWEFTPQR